jgi:hypothetical protein
MRRVKFTDPAMLSLLTHPQDRAVFKSMIEDQETFDVVVDKFAHAMKRKLATKTLAGYEGGLEEENRQEVLARVVEHWERFIRGDNRQIVDVANLLMMLWSMDGGKE